VSLPPRPDGTIPGKDDKAATGATGAIGAVGAKMGRLFGFGSKGKLASGKGGSPRAESKGSASGGGDSQRREQRQQQSRQPAGSGGRGGEQKWVLRNAGSPPSRLSGGEAPAQEEPRAGGPRPLRKSPAESGTSAAARPRPTREQDAETPDGGASEGGDVDAESSAAGVDGDDGSGDVAEVEEDGEGDEDGEGEGGDDENDDDNDDDGALITTCAMYLCISVCMFVGPSILSTAVVTANSRSFTPPAAATTTTTTTTTAAAAAAATTTTNHQEWKAQCRTNACRLSQQLDRNSTLSQTSLLTSTRSRRSFFLRSTQNSSCK
jgi:hypothetical protein